jgi:transglutaminase-like putative cysteine protease
MPVPVAGAAPVGADIQYLLVDRQLQYGETSQTYGRFVLQLLNESGVQQNSQINIDFDPEREKLRVHGVTLQRDGKTIDALASGRVETLQRERNLERNLLDGSLTFHLLLADVRVGDTLEYSFTIERRDTEWNDKHYSRLITAWGEPVVASRVRLTVGVDAPLRYGLDRESAPSESRSGTWRILEWNWRDIPGQPSEASTPGWHPQQPSIELSQFLNWKDVVTPALRLYALPTTTGPELAVHADKIRASNSTDAARALAVIRFVQEEIRYTGLELGAGAFKPSDPELVLRRRYGDCKDKTFLAVSMLRTLGIEAQPALVSSVWEAHLDARLPSPGAFDHVIVRARVDGSWYWWDVTDTAQGGGLADFIQSDLGSGLIIAAGSTGIEKFPVQMPRTPEFNVNLVFDVRAGLDAESTITVISRYRGRQADSMRRRLRSQTVSELGLQYENYYKRIYPKILSAGEPKIADDMASNALTVEERYKGSELFERPDTEGVRRFSLDADYISSSLSAPSTPVRKMPLALTYPVNAAVKIEVRLPEEWTIKPEDMSVGDGHFQYQSRHRRIGNDVFLEYSYRTLADNVPVARLEEHLRQREKARADSNFQFTYKPNADAADDPVAQLSKRARDILNGKGNPTSAQSWQRIDELRKSDAWDKLPDELRQALAVFAGAIAFGRDDWNTAHAEMKQGIALSSDGDLWLQYVQAASRAGEAEDAADAAATLLENFPNEFRSMGDDTVAEIVWESESRGLARYRLLTAMFRHNYQRHDGLEISDWWTGLIAAQLERNQLDAARLTLGRVRSPASLIQIQADRRFESVRSSLASWQQVDRMTDAYLEFLQSLSQANPRSLSIALELSMAQTKAHRFDAAMQSLDASLLRASAADGSKYFIDYADRYRWLLDYRSRALGDLERWDEALLQMRQARSMKSSDLVSQGINLAGLYNDMGRPRDARAELAKLDRNSASEFGRQMMAAVALESAIQLGDNAEAARQIEYLGAHSQIDPSSYLFGLLSLDRIDEAVAQTIRMLADVEQQTSVLMAAQTYPVGKSSAARQRTYQRWRQVLERPAVHEAIRRIGSIGTYQWTNPMFGY